MPWAARPLAPDLLGPELRVPEHGVGVHDVRADAVRRALERQHLRELGLGGLGGGVRGEVLARRHHVLGGDEHERCRRAPARSSTRIASRATRKWPVALTAKERSQSASAIVGHRRAVRDAGVRDEDVEPAVGEHRRLERRAHRGLAGHVHAEAERAPAADRRGDLVRDRARARPRRGRATTTCAPSAASRRATARPIPGAPPVTSATRRASSFSGGASVSL